MAKINQYPAKTVPSDNDEFVLHDPASGSTKKMTRGDLISGAPLPANSINEQAIADGSVTPRKRSGGFYVGVISSSTLSTTGNKNITGVGFKPRMVEFQGLPAAAGDNILSCTGVMDEAGRQSTTAIAAGTGEGALKRNSSTTACIGFVGTGSSNFLLLASYVSMNNNGFTINVSIPNSGLPISYKAYA